VKLIPLSPGSSGKSHFLLALAAIVVCQACHSVHADDTDKGLPPPAKVVPMVDLALFTVDHPEQYPLATADERSTTSELVVTGAVTPDVSRNVPVVSLASGRISGVHARLGDSVKQGQLLFTVRSDDVSGGYSTYRMAMADEVLAKAQMDRAKDLLEHGAISLNDLQVSQDTESKARIAVDTAAEHLRLLGNDPDKPDAMVNIYAPASGVITDQEVTNSSAIQAFNTPSPFTISDLSVVWVICDVYENDLATVKIGDPAEIRLNAYPDRIFRGTVSNIGATLDPNIRTGKVRIEVPNPGVMRLGMFVKAVFHGQKKETHTVVPASAIVHMHDRDYVFVPEENHKFRRVEVVSGDPLPDDKSRQEVISGLEPGRQVVTNALILDHAVTQ
jgi:cobalt-zinc-cadmium efflux system membrane fusion protein